MWPGYVTLMLADVCEHSTQIFLECQLAHRTDWKHLRQTDANDHRVDIEEVGKCTDGGLSIRVEKPRQSELTARCQKGRYRDVDETSGKENCAHHHVGLVFPRCGVRARLCDFATAKDFRSAAFGPITEQRLRLIQSEERRMQQAMAGLVSQRGSHASLGWTGTVIFQGCREHDLLNAMRSESGQSKDSGRQILVSMRPADSFLNEPINSNGRGLGGQKANFRQFARADAVDLFL